MSKKICKGCGKNLDIESNFQKHPKGEGYFDLCKECKNKQMVETRARKAAEKKTKITLDFSNYPEILKNLIQVAKKNFRDPESQIMFMLAGSGEGLESMNYPIEELIQFALKNPRTGEFARPAGLEKMIEEDEINMAVRVAEHNLGVGIIYFELAPKFSDYQFERAIELE